MPTRSRPGPGQFYSSDVQRLTGVQNDTMLARLVNLYHEVPGQTVSPGSGRHRIWTADQVAAIRLSLRLRDPSVRLAHPVIAVATHRLAAAHEAGHRLLVVSGSEVRFMSERAFIAFTEANDTAFTVIDLDPLWEGLYD